MSKKLFLLIVISPIVIFALYKFGLFLLFASILLVFSLQNLLIFLGICFFLYFIFHSGKKVFFK